MPSAAEERAVRRALALLLHSYSRDTDAIAALVTEIADLDEAVYVILSLLMLHGREERALRTMALAAAMREG